jgi:hypothetical protein
MEVCVKQTLCVSVCKWLLPLCLIAVLVSIPSQVRADELTVAGDATGSFSGTGDFASNGLTFAGDSFDTTTSGGFGSINLGTLSLGSDPTSYLGTFDLNVTFTAPTGISGGDSSDFTALLLGNVSSSGSGAALLLNFAPGMDSYTFTNAADTGSFTIILPSSISVTEGSSSTLTASIIGRQTDAPVNAPESGTLLFTALGLVAVIGAYRKYGSTLAVRASRA